ncbi:hypothetical protein [Streptomyces sp. Ru87]|nr:hypothetical protein [Streptomyces sp. Ru87]
MTLSAALRLALAALADAALAAVSADERETFQAAYDRLSADPLEDSQ